MQFVVWLGNNKSCIKGNFVTDAQELVSLFSSLILICYRNGDSKLTDSTPHTTVFVFICSLQYFEELAQTHSLYLSIETVIGSSTTLLCFVCKTWVHNGGAMCVLVAACLLCEIIWRISVKYSRSICVYKLSKRIYRAACKGNLRSKCLCHKIRLF